MSIRKYGIRLENGIPDYEQQQLVGDLVIPPVIVTDVRIALPCGDTEIVAALEVRGVSIPKEERRKAMLSELQAQVGSLAKKIASVISANQAAKD